MGAITILFCALILVLILVITQTRSYLRIRNNEQKLGKQERQLNAANQIISDQRIEIIALKKDISMLQHSLYNTDTVVHKIRNFSNLSVEPCLSEQEWHVFLNLLEDIFRFTSRLSKSYPLLNNNDIRVCALLKEEVKPDHIAMLMNTSYEDIKAQINSIEKEKMNLDNTESLKDYLKVFLK